MSLDILFAVRKCFATTLRTIKVEVMDEKTFSQRKWSWFQSAVNPADFGDHIFKNIQKKRINSLTFR